MLKYPQAVFLPCIFPYGRPHIFDGPEITSVQITAKFWRDSEMELIPCAGSSLKKVRRLYIEAFPPAERKPFPFIKWKVRRGKMEMYELYEDGFAGLAIFALYKDLALLTFFAVDPKRRNGGLGSQALAAIKEKYPDKRIFLEIEKPDGGDGDEIKRRRKGFYLRNGLSEAGIDVVLFGIPMEVLSFNCSVTGKEYKEIYDNTIGKTLSKNIKLV